MKCMLPYNCIDLVIFLFIICTCILSPYRNESSPNFGVVLTGEKKMDPPPEMSVGIIIAAVLAVILCMAIATGMIVILIKRCVFGCENTKIINV